MGAGGQVKNGRAEPRRVGPARTGLPRLCQDSLVWEVRGTFEAAEPVPELVEFAVEALRRERLELAGALNLARHRPGDRGLPPAAVDADYRFAIDLTDARSSVDGGVLLFLDETGRGPGWRAEAGAMTIWSGADPELTELVPGAPERLTLFGQARTPSRDGEGLPIPAP